MFKCTDGANVEVFGTTDRYGHTDYYDCAIYDHEYKDTARNNFIRAYIEIVKSHPGIRPLKMDKLLKEMIEEANKKK